MRAGLLDTIILIHRPVVKTSESGQRIKDYVFHYKTRARKVQYKGSRDIENKEILWNYPLMLEIYRYVDVNEQDLIYIDEKKYRILSIQDDRKQNKKIINCELVNE